MVLTGSGAAEADAVDERTERARKILPRFARGEVHRVAVCLNLAEAEMVQGILLEEGIPSVLRRSGGFDVPDFLAAGPRDVMVPASGVEAARELLGTQGDAPIELEPSIQRRAAFRLAAVLLVGLLLFGALTGLILALTA
jgi:Putative prokaryotic signal transducing protein